MAGLAIVPRPPAAPEDSAMHAIDPDEALCFMLAGNATFTLLSLKTGTRYTYKIKKAEESPDKPPVWFVRARGGAEFEYIGQIVGAEHKLSIPLKTERQVAIAWFLDKAVKGKPPKDCAIYHANRCGRCGRQLTDPISVTSGFGPECRGKA